MAELTCVVVTPEETALEQAASFVVVPLYDGELGIAPGHSPLVGRLGRGELRIRSAGNANETQRFYVDGGFVQIDKNVVSILTSRTVPVRQIDVSAAEQQLKRAIGMQANTPELMEARDREMDQARAQLRAARV